MPGYCSDHSLVYFGYKTDIVKRHHPLWKFNNSLLQDKVFVNLVKQVILDLEKKTTQYAIPVYYRQNIIHKTKEEELFFTVDDQLFFLNDPSENQRELYFLCFFQKGGD